MATGHHVEVGSPVHGHTPKDSRPAVDPAEVRQQCERILADPLFSHSRRYSDLLQYIVEKTLDGQHECLKERIIGIEVFGRTPDYDTSHDATVRVAITEVRKRLVRYFEDPQHHDEMRIVLPAGAYVAEFAPAHADLPAAKYSLLQRWPRYIYVGLTACVVVLVLGLWGVRRLTPTPAIDQFWAPMVENQGPVPILMGEPVPGEPPLPAGTSTGTSASESSLARFISKQVTFPITELNAANSINSFLAQKGVHSTIRLAKSATLSELHGTPVIVLGSYPNEWALRLGSGLRFRFQQNASGSLNWIEDTSNPGRVWAISLTAPIKEVPSEYALITRALDSTTGQWWIGIGGTTVLGTLGSYQMLLDPASVSAVTSTLPKGWAHKNLQIVVEFKMVDGSLGASKVVGTNVW